MLDYTDGTRVMLVQSSGRSGELVAAMSEAPLSLRTWTHLAGALDSHV
jgi:hypothetical protein